MKISVQLYTLRDQMGQDPVGTLRELGKMGYRYVETAGLAGKSAKEFRAILQDANLKASGMHVGYGACDTEMNKVLDEAQTLGSPYVIVPGLPGEAIQRGWEWVGTKLQEFGEKASARKIGFAYHNHAHEFDIVDKKLAYDRLFAAACPDHVKCQIDLWWAYYGLVDPAKLVRRYGTRVRLVHLKDGKGRGDAPQAEAGQGVMDWNRVLAACDEAKVEFGVVELDTCPRPPLESVRMCLDYFRGRGYRG